MNPKLKIVNKILALFLFACNVFYFIPLNVKNVYSGFGPMGFGLIAFPFIVIINLFTIPSYFTFKEKYNTIETLIINSIAVFILVYLFINYKIM